MKDTRDSFSRMMDHPKFEELMHVAVGIVEAVNRQNAARADIEDKRLDKTTPYDVLKSAVDGLRDANTHLHDMCVESRDGGQRVSHVPSREQISDDADFYIVWVSRAVKLAELLGVMAADIDELADKIDRLPSLDSIPSRHELPDGSFTNSTLDALMAWYTHAMTGDQQQAEAQGKRRQEAAARIAARRDPNASLDIDALDREIKASGEDDAS